MMITHRGKIALMVAFMAVIVFAQGFNGNLDAFEENHELRGYFAARDVAYVPDQMSVLPTATTDVVPEWPTDFFGGGGPGGAGIGPVAWPTETSILIETPGLIPTLTPLPPVDPIDPTSTDTETSIPTKSYTYDIPSWTFTYDGGWPTLPPKSTESVTDTSSESSTDTSTGSATSTPSETSPVTTPESTSATSSETPSGSSTPITSPGGSVSTWTTWTTVNGTPCPTVVTQTFTSVESCHSETCTGKATGGNPTVTEGTAHQAPTQGTATTFSTVGGKPVTQGTGNAPETASGTSTSHGLATGGGNGGGNGGGTGTATAHDSGVSTGSGSTQPGNGHGGNVSRTTTTGANSGNTSKPSSNASTNGHAASTTASFSQADSVRVYGSNVVRAGILAIFLLAVDAF